MAPYINGIENLQATKTAAPIDPRAQVSYSWARNDNLGNRGYHTNFPPAAAVHASKIWLMFADQNNFLYYCSGDNTALGGIQPFPADNHKVSAAPALCDVAGTLHCAFPEETGNLVDWTWNDQTSQWSNRNGVGGGVTCNGDPALTSLDGNKLLCVYRDGNNDLYFSIWSPSPGGGGGGWSSSVTCGERSWGCPALFNLTVGGKSQVYCVFAANNSRVLISISFDSATNSWARASSPSQEFSAYGVKGDSYNGEAFVSFQGNNADGSDYVSTYSNGTWHNHEGAGELSTDTPTICAYNDYLNLFFNSHNNNTLLWTQRPLLGITIPSWMSTVADATLLSNMTIPGTHDTAAINKMIPYVTTQMMSIPRQLNSGIRYLDLRCQENNGSLEMYHGPIDLGLSLIQVLEMLETFLIANPTEVIITQVKDEGDPSSPGFAAAFQATLEANNNRFGKLFELGVTTPTLGNVRGKIQLVRRFSSPSWPVGIDVSNGWQDNNANFDIITPSGVKLTIQDEYEPHTAVFYSALVTRKVADSQALLTQAKEDTDPGHWYINFTSAYASSKISGFYAPRKVALGYFSSPGVNYELDTWITGQDSKACWGVVLYNFPESPQDLLVDLIMSNTFQPSAKTGPLISKQILPSVQKRCSSCGNVNTDKFTDTLERFTDTMNRCLPAVERYLKQSA